MDASLCLEHLDRLLVEEATALAQLETALDKELTVITGDDVDALERVGAEREACMGELVRIEADRHALCRVLGKPSTLTGLGEVVKWCDSRDTLRARLDECNARAGRCRARNDRNGMLVNARLKQVSGLLNIVTGRTQPTTYGRQPAYAVPTGRMIRSEA